MRRIIEDGGAGFDEKLRDFVVVQIGADGEIVSGSDGAEDQQDLILFDELTGERRALGGVGSVVHADESDFAAVDSAAIVDHLEVGGFGAGDGGIFAGPAGVGRDVTDFDFGVGRAGVVGLLGCGGRCGDCDGERRDG